MAAELRSKLQEALNDARRERDRLRTVVLSTALSELRNREIELGREAADEDVRDVLGRALKQRREASEQMRAGGRPELADREDREAGILAEFLPPPMGEADVREIVRGILSEGVRDPGPIMGRLMPRIKNRFDGKEANRIVREELERA